MAYNNCSTYSTWCMYVCVRVYTMCIQYISIHIKVTVCKSVLNILSLDLWTIWAAVIFLIGGENGVPQRDQPAPVDYSIMSEPDCNWIYWLLSTAWLIPQAKAAHPGIYCIAHRASNRKAAIRLHYSCSVPFYNNVLPNPNRVQNVLLCKCLCLANRRCKSCFATWSGLCEHHSNAIDSVGYSSASSFTWFPCLLICLLQISLF